MSLTERHSVYLIRAIMHNKPRIPNYLSIFPNNQSVSRLDILSTADENGSYLKDMSSSEKLACQLIMIFNLLVGTHFRLLVLKQALFLHTSISVNM